MERRETLLALDACVWISRRERGERGGGWKTAGTLVAYGPSSSGETKERDDSHTVRQDDKKNQTEAQKRHSSYRVSAVEKVQPAKYGTWLYEKRQQVMMYVRGLYVCEVR